METQTQSGGVDAAEGERGTSRDRSPEQGPVFLNEESSVGLSLRFL